MPIPRREGTTQRNLPGRIKELEESLRGCEREKQLFSLQVQTLARQVAAENERLRALVETLGHQTGSAHDEIHPGLPATGPRHLEQRLPSQTVALSQLEPTAHQYALPITDTLERLPQTTTATQPQPPPKLCPCSAPTPKLAVPPSLRHFHDDNEKRPKIGNVVTCQQALEIINTTNCGREFDDLRETLGCTSECCPDLDTCEIENGLLMMIMDQSI